MNGSPLYGHATGIRTGQTNNDTVYRASGTAYESALNDERISSMQHRVAMLREISIGIGEEVRAQNQFLNEMSDDFESTGTLLGTTIKRFQRMAARQRAGGWMCYMCLFVIASFAFMLFYVKIWRS